MPDSLVELEAGNLPPPPFAEGVVHGDGMVHSDNPVLYSVKEQNRSPHPGGQRERAVFFQISFPAKCFIIGQGEEEGIDPLPDKGHVVRRAVVGDDSPHFRVYDGDAEGLIGPEGEADEPHLPACAVAASGEGARCGTDVQYLQLELPLPTLKGDVQPFQVHVVGRVIVHDEGGKTACGHLAGRSGCTPATILPCRVAERCTGTDLLPAGGRGRL